MPQTLWEAIGDPPDRNDQQKWRQWHQQAERYIENMARSGQASSLADLGIYNEKEKGAAMYGTQWGDSNWWNEQRKYGHEGSFRDVASGAPDAHWQALPGTDIIFAGPMTGGPGLQNFRYASRSDPNKTYSWDEVRKYEPQLRGAVNTLSQNYASGASGGGTDWAAAMGDAGGATPAAPQVSEQVQPAGNAWGGWATHYGRDPGAGVGGETVSASTPAPVTTPESNVLAPNDQRFAAGPNIGLGDSTGDGPTKKDSGLEYDIPGLTTTNKKKKVY